MSDEFQNLAQIAADALVSAMAADSWQAAGCSDTPTTCTSLWTASTAYFEGMTITDGDVLVTDEEGAKAFDAAGTTNCSGTPKICTPLWATSTNISTGPGFTLGSGFASGRQRGAIRPEHENASILSGGALAVANGVRTVRTWLRGR
jgi:hypothetical protein